jgi:hypothetical protein
VESVGSTTVTLGTAVVGDVPSGSLITLVAGVERAVSGPSAETEKPAYQQTLGWRIANWLTPISH